MILVQVLVVLAIAVANRIRGGMFQSALSSAVPLYGTTVGRLLYATTLGLGSIALGGGLLLFLAIIVGTFVGHAIAPFAPFQFMERSNDVLVMSLRGLILTTGIGLAIMGLHSVVGGVVMALGGALMGPAYLLGSKLPAVPAFNDNPSTLSTNDTSEVIFGIVTGILLVLAI